ncbi:MAG: sulfotransferase family protein [Candidatus Latescibacteria bacterium]|jgi:hypothetical protein|nr:sulfotransferase family protein [Candidatus Latescibacterota bacterium]
MVSNARDDPIAVVSGLPRSGTSMMMQMIEAGGMPVLMDTARAADEDNPRGYYEYEPVKRLEADGSWLYEAQGKAVKVVSELLRYLPVTHDYRVVFMDRRMAEILASQRAMLARRETGQEADVDDAQMAAIYRKHLSQVWAWIEARPNVVALRVDYGEVVASPGVWASKIAQFLSAGLDPHAMAKVVDASLHRQARDTG